MAELVEKTACPSCPSSDAMAWYDDGSGYCFSCNHWLPPGADAPVRQKVGKSKEKLSITDVEDTRYTALGSRRITEETCKFFGYQVGMLKGKPVQIAPFYKEGKAVAWKLRGPDKKFLGIGDTKNYNLFGSHKWRDSGKKVIITEGEIDCMSISQLQKNQWPVVSVPNGASGAAKSIAKQIEWLEKFDEVVFAFDMDEPGQAAARECAAILSPGKAKIATLPLKDANECLVAGKAKELIDALWGAKTYLPDGVLDISDLADEMCAEVEEGRSWPWETLTEFTYGIRRGEIYTLGAGTGCGKSTLFKQVGKHLLEEHKVPIGTFFLEEPARVTAKTLAGMVMGQVVHLPGVEFDKGKLRAVANSLSGRVSIYDPKYGANWDTVQAKIRYMRHSLGIRDFFIDHVTAIAATFKEDERVALDKLMADMGSLVQELDCTFYLISHLSTPEGKSHEEHGRVLEKHFRGSRSIAFWSHFIFALERDKQDRNGITTFRVLKDRFSGRANGVTFGLKYDKDTGLQNECPIPKKKESGEEMFTEEEY